MASARPPAENVSIDTFQTFGYWEPSGESTDPRVALTDRFITEGEDDINERLDNKRVAIWLCRACGSLHQNASEHCAHPRCKRQGKLVRLIESYHTGGPGMQHEITGVTQWVTAAKVAEYLCVAEGTVRNWAQARVIPAHKIRRVLRFDLAEIEAWARNQSEVRRSIDGGKTNVRD